MKIKSDEINDETLLGEIIQDILSFRHDIYEQACKKGYVNAKLNVNGQDFDVKRFFDCLEKEYDKAVDIKATMIASQKFDEVNKKMIDYQNRLTLAFQELNK